MSEIDYTAAEPAPFGMLSGTGNHPVLDGTVAEPIPPELAETHTTEYHTAGSAYFGQPGPGQPPGFHEWLDKWVAAVAPAVESKASEYGSGSLARKGYRFAAAQGRAVSEPEALDLGAELYALEKADRIEDALGRQRPASADTLVDGAVYLLMSLYIRDTGHWA